MRRYLWIISLIFSLWFGTSLSFAQNTSPHITSFTSTLTSVERSALQNRSARVPLAWTTANRPLFANLVFEQVFDEGTAVSVELPRANPWVNSNEKGIAAPFIPPNNANAIRLRVRLVHFFLPIVYDQRELILPINDGTQSPVITRFVAAVNRINGAQLASGTLRVPVSWTVVNRPSNTQLVFEQMLEDNTWVNVELPRSNPYVASSGDGVVALVNRPYTSPQLLIRVRLLDMRSGVTLTAEVFTLAIDALMPPTTPPPANTASFDVQPRRVREGDSVTITWNVPNAASVDLMMGSPTMRFAWTKINANVLPASGSYTHVIPLGSRKLSFFNPNNMDASQSIEVIVDCYSGWAVELGQTAETVCPYGGEGTYGSPLVQELIHQVFVGGQMLAYQGQIFVLYNDGTGHSYPNNWDGSAPADLGLIPPTGQVLPTSAFGNLWTKEASVRDRLGFASAHERRYSGGVQTGQLNATNELFLIQLPDTTYAFIQRTYGALNWWNKVGG